MKLDRSRAALVVVDVQEAFRPAVLDFEQVAAQRRACWCRARAILGLPTLVTEQYPKGLGHTVPEVAEHLDASSRSRRSASARSTPTGFRRAARGAPRPGAAVRHRGARVREPDRRGPARRRRRGPRRAGRGHLAHGGEPRRSACTRWSAPAPTLTSVETALFELLRAGRHAGVQGSPGAGQMSAPHAYVLLEDGTRLDGEAVGAPAPAVGEVVFNTAMTGYQEAVTDPSYAGQIITFTYPLIGNYGVWPQARRVRPRARARGDHARAGERRARRAPTAAGSTGCAPAAWPGIGGVDTRGLVRHIRDRGAMRGGVFPGEHARARGARADRRRAADAGPRPRARGDARRSRSWSATGDGPARGGARHRHQDARSCAT